MANERRSKEGDKRRSTTTEEESSMRKGSTVHAKSQVDIEGEPKTKPNLRQTIDEEKVVYQRLTTNDVANTNLTEVRYDGTT